MGKRLSTRVKINRLHDQGFSDRQIADITGFSKSSVGRIRRGQQSGEGIASAISEFFKLGKKAKANVISGAIPLPSAKPQKAKETGEVFGPIFVSPLRRAEGKISQLDGDTKVVIQLTSAKTGKSRTLFARGGIEAGEISGDLEGAIRKQAALQGRGNAGSISDPVVEFDDVIDIDVQEY